MRTSCHSRREFIKDFLMTGAGPAAAALVTVGARAASSPVRMSLQLGWAVGSAQVGEIVARRMGFYAQEGLDITIRPGGPSVDGVAVVASKHSELGVVSSSPSVMLAVSQGIPIRCFAVGAQRHPYSFFSRESHAVRKPTDLQGKRIAIHPTGLVLLRALLAKHGLAEKDVRIVPSGTSMAPLLTGQADVVTGWSTNTTAIKGLGEGVVQLLLWDAGVRLYGLPYYAETRVLQNRSRELEGFLRATARGWHHASAHREQSVDMVLREYPQFDREDERIALDRMLQFSFGGLTRSEGWGAMDPAFWQEQIDLYAALGQFSARKPALTDVVTLDLLKATRSARLRTA